MARYGDYSDQETDMILRRPHSHQAGPNNMCMSCGRPMPCVDSQVLDLLDVKVLVGFLDRHPEYRRPGDPTEAPFIPPKLVFEATRVGA